MMPNHIAWLIYVACALGIVCAGAAWWTTP